MNFRICILFCCLIEIGLATARCTPNNDPLLRSIPQRWTAWLEQLVSSEFERIVPVTNTSRWDKVCSDLRNITNCVSASTDPEEVTEKPYLEKIAAIFCDADIKSSFDCLSNISQTPSPRCKTQCQRYKPAITSGSGSDAFVDNGTLHTEKVNEFCKFVNCRFTCRKPDIITSCQQSGFEAAKKLLKAVGALGQVYFPNVNVNPALHSTAYPAACTPDALVRET